MPHPVVSVSALLDPQVTGRVAHSAAYVLDLAAAVGFQALKLRRGGVIVEDEVSLGCGDVLQQ